MLKVTETKETIEFLSLVAFQLPPPGYAYAPTRVALTLHKIFSVSQLILEFVCVSV